MEAKLTKVGNSVGLMIPSALRRTMRLEAGQAVTIEETNEGLLLRPAAKHRYTLAQLLSQCNPDAPMPNDIKDWDATAPVGHEAW